MALRSFLQPTFIYILIISIFLLVPSQTAIATTSSTANINILETLKIFGTKIGLVDTDPRIIIVRLVRVAMSFIGIIMLFMIFSSGFLLMVSGGDQEKVKYAKRTFFNAVIGLSIILSAYSVISFVFHSFAVVDT